jgi:hypothetical protein
MFKEGFGVLGGAIGTYVGGLAGIGIVTILGLGPVGLFVAVFVCTTIGGIALMKLGQGVGDKIYNYYEPMFNTGSTYNSPEQFLIEVAK